MTYITGDTHGNFKRIIDFCKTTGTTRDDILIILGDAGINFHSGSHDEILKETLSKLDITLFCIHGNHEIRPERIETYHQQEWHGGVVYMEDKYPNILFAKDGEIFDIDGASAIVIGGAYSIDKQYRLIMNYGWWPDEQPSDAIKQYVENQLQKNGWKIDVVLSHTVPLKYEPVEAFLNGVNQNLVDKTTEKWLDKIEDKLEYKKWYAGHYHIEKLSGKLRLMFNAIDELHF